jgi:hypothetical protein
MKYLLCEIRNDNVLVVLKKSITEEEAKESCEWSDKYENRTLVLIPHKSLIVEVNNYGNDITAKIE